MERTERSAERGIRFFSIVVACVLLISFEAIGGPQKPGKEGAMRGSEEINAVLSVWGYGYKIKVLVNGEDVGIKGGMSESKRLFDKNNEMAAQATPEIRKKNFVLVNGANTIAVEYKKEGSDRNDRAEVTLEVENYPAPVFKLVSKKPSGKVEKTIMIQGKAPADFKTVTAE